MLTEIIAIGDEITSGERLDTNSQWLSRELSELGARVRWHTAVGDDLPAMIGVIDAALKRADCLVATGGLGPTADDLTRAAVAAAAGVELTLDQRQLDRIEQLFRRRGREMPAANRRQAELPLGAEAIDNPHGSAPGIDLTLARSDEGVSRLFALPGVPAEMKEMFRESVAPAVRTLLGEQARTITHYCLKCFGVGESDLEAMLPDLIRRGRDPQVGITVSQATITLRITAEGPDARQCREKMEPTIELIHQALGNLVFGEADDELEHAVVRQLRQAGSTLCVAEWGSGGELSRRLREVDPQGELFRGGLVLGSDAQRSRLGLPQADHGDALSQQALAAAMARYARDWFETDFALAIGDFPHDVDAANAPRFVGLAVEGPFGSIARARNFAGHPDVRGPRAIKQALDLLRLRLLGVPLEPLG